ncbi:MAG: aldehyde dehydrogenase family protein, partial [Planctomycetota bacterium]
VIVEPTIESANEIFSHPDVAMLGVTGGPGVVAVALKSGKRAICAGPGNPPVVVDSSADLDNAARCIIEGGAYDNNLLCLAEKEVFVEAVVYDAFMAAMAEQGGCRLSAQQMDVLAKICIVPGKDGGHPHANKKFVGAEPEVLAREINVSVPSGCRMLFGETSATHDWVMAEQMMPCMPIVKCQTFEDCVEAALVAEHAFKHTSIIHSRLVDHMTYMGKAMDTTLFVKNGPSLAGNGAGGEGYGGYSIACATGEGICTPRIYTRTRRCAMIDNLRIV